MLANGPRDRGVLIDTRTLGPAVQRLFAYAQLCCYIGDRRLPPRRMRLTASALKSSSYRGRLRSDVWVDAMSVSLSGTSKKPRHLHPGDLHACHAAVNSYVMQVR